MRYGRGRLDEDAARSRLVEHCPESPKVVVGLRLTAGRADTRIVLGAGASDEPKLHSMKTVRLAFALVLAFQATTAQGSASSDIELREWASASYRWLQGQITPSRTVPDPEPGRRGLLVSYDVPPETGPWYHRSAIYDNALAALAAIVMGDRDRAAYALHAVTRTARPDGSFWFGYNTANDWPSETDHESALVRAGAISWVGYALSFYLEQYPTCSSDDRGCTRERAGFLDAAVRAADYLLSLQVQDPLDVHDGLVRLGAGEIALSYEADGDRIVELYTDRLQLGISTENNISTWFFLRRLAAVTGSDRYSRAANSIRRALLAAVWNDQLGQFNQGVTSTGDPDPLLALDCASWGALFLAAIGEGDKADRSLATVELRYGSRDGAHVGFRPYADTPVYANAEVGHFFFPSDPRKKWEDLPLVWPEGTLGVAFALLRHGERDEARRVVENLGTLRAPGGGLPYASRDVPFHMTAAPAVASAAWLVIVIEALSGNPVAEEFWK